MGINVLVSWPRNTDYPLWRQMIRDNRHRFKTVNIVFTETNYGNNVREFVRNAMKEDNVTFADSPQPIKDDWRNVAVNFGIKGIPYDSQDWVWFTEQDFFPQDGFWKSVEFASAQRNAGAIGIIDGKRLHPACIFIKQEVLKRTRQNFSIEPNKADHFHKVQDDLERLAQVEAIRTLILDPGTYHHMAGLSHNMRLMTEGEKPNHNIDDFTNYLKGCLKTSVPMDYYFAEAARNFLAKRQG